MQIKNTTRQTLTFVAKDGGIVDVGPEETVTAPGVDTEHAGFVGAKLAGAITIDEPSAAPAATSNAVPSAQPQGWDHQ